MVATYLSILFRQLAVFGSVATAQIPFIIHLANVQLNLWSPLTLLGFSFLSELVQVSLVGLAQWLVLRRLFNISPHWISATVVGAAVVAAPFEYALVAGVAAEASWLQGEFLGLSNDIWILLSSFGITALLVSILQWLLLRRYLQGAGWWIPASVLITVAAYLLVTQTGLSFFGWRQAMRMGPIATFLGVPTAERLASMIPGVMLELVKQAGLGAVMLALSVPHRLRQRSTLVPA